MPRLTTPLLVLGLTVTACGGSAPPAASAPPAIAATSASPSAPTSPPPSPSPSSEPLPPGVPSSFGRALPAREVPTHSLVPRGAAVTSVWYVAMSDGRSEEIVVAWSVGSDPFQAAHGLAVWQPFPDRPAWRAVYAFLDPVRRGVFVIRVQQGDLTGDGVTDLLSFEDTDGSGACGVWRVLATEPGAMSELYRRHTCDTQIDVADGTLRVATSVYDAGDAHCCPSATRRTTLKWDGAEWTIVDRELVRND